MPPQASIGAWFGLVNNTLINAVPDYQFVAVYKKQP